MAAGPGDTVVFAVADTGIGIPPEDQERIFQEFTQLENPRQKYVRGTGLGLSLVKKLAELLGGRVELKSEVGIGSTFSVVLPCVYQGPPEVAYVPEVSIQPDPARRPVLVVEDNRETLFIYEKFLKGSPFQVIPARTLKDARRAVERIRPAAAVLDVMLEGESTWELLTELKQRKATRDIPVLVVTLVDNRHKALALGADAFCPKPVDRSWLLDTFSALAKTDGPESVLLIDDDEACRYLLKGYLATMRFRVIEAATGRDGLQRAQQERPRAIFLDLQMPDLSGFDVLKILQADPATRAIPVLIHTSQVLENGERAPGRGVVDPSQRGLVPGGGSDRVTRGPGQIRVGRGRDGAVAMSAKPTTILVVDDTPGSRYTITKMLQKARYQVKEAATAREALRWRRKNRTSSSST